ncbi:MAG TPA: cobalamin-binding protein [Firmicutes bacterium]|jgi:dimethylamine corrinoid protein|nr:cobalamin-binding protein [Bacillota bacterium]
MSEQEILEQLAHTVVEGEEETAGVIAQQALDAGIDPGIAIVNGLAKGMETVGHYFESQRYFLPEVVLASLAFQAGVKVLQPHLKATAVKTGVVVLGTVQGDTHDIGKNLVAIMLGAAGFEVHDVGRDVPPEVFAAKVKETRANILGLSALMTTSMAGMKTVIDLLKKEGLREQVKIMIGGAPVSERYAHEIGADAYSVDAVSAVRLAQSLVS